MTDIVNRRKERADRGIDNIQTRLGTASHQDTVRNITNPACSLSSFYKAPYLCVCNSAVKCECSTLKKLTTVVTGE